MDLSIRVKKFIEQEWDQKSPLLLGYSGGPDSKALLYALLKTAAAKFLHLAHIDHGWREESAAEAKLLAEEAAVLHLPFSTIRLSNPPMKNREDAARSARLAFFRSLFDRIPFQALLLAHHADDAAETALKRLLEGAHLHNLGGMTKISHLDGMPVWRPLLQVRKIDILSEGLAGFDDETNRSYQFLRGRLRLDILPMLAKSFGKEVSPNLALLSERAFELKEYLDRKIESLPFWSGPWGVAADLGKVERVEARHFLLSQAELSREVLESILTNIYGTHLQFGPAFVDRGWVFFRAGFLPEFTQDIALRAGRFESGDWTLEITPLQEGAACNWLWKDFWRGDFVLNLPDGVLQRGEKISHEEYRIFRIPSHLRPLIPSLDGKNIFTRFSRPRWQVRFFVGVRSSSLER